MDSSGHAPPEQSTLKRQSCGAETRPAYTYEVCANVCAFAVIQSDGGVVTWGVFGGDSSAVQEQLRNVQAIQATRGAFATILVDLGRC